jgi:serine protease AprX
VKSAARTLTGAVLAAAMVTVVTGQTPAVATPRNTASQAPATSATSAASAMTLSSGGYLVGVRHGALSGVTAGLRAQGITVRQTFPALDTLVAQVPSGHSVRVSDPRITSISRDATVGLASWHGDWAPSGDPNSLHTVATRIGASYAWGHGLTGAGIGVALIDSGVAPEPGLDSAGKVVQGPDLSLDSQSASVAHLDEFGHGTHMAGIIAGHDAGVSPSDTTNPDNFVGIAPNARIINVKVADAHGVADVSQVIAGIDWVVEHAHDPGMNIRVLNLSFGTASQQDYRLDPLAHAAEVAWRNGIVVVASAGNSGSRDHRLTDPAIDPYVIAVGAEDTHGTFSRDDDTIPDFSSQGDGRRNPDLVAPGVHIPSLRVAGSFIDQEYGDAGGVTDRLLRGSGTSQAAAVVSGAVALVLQAHPSATPDQIKAALISNAKRLPSAQDQAEGHGMISLAGLTWPWPLPPATQWFPQSTGGGTLEGSRGEGHAVLSGVELRGDNSIFGPVDVAALAQAEEDGTAWDGTRWGGANWAVDSEPASSWAGTSWAGTSWAGTSWATGNWDGTSWAGTSWAGTSWAGTSWAGTSWAGSSWAGTSWATSDWS